MHHFSCPTIALSHTTNLQFAEAESLFYSMQKLAPIMESSTGKLGMESLLGIRIQITLELKPIPID
jgi:hypothetical protein